VTRITGNLHEDEYTFCIINGSVLRMRNVSDKSCRENQNRHFTYSIPPPPPKCLLLGNLEKYGRAGQATDDNMARVHSVLDT